MILLAHIMHSRHLQMYFWTWFLFVRGSRIHVTPQQQKANRLSFQGVNEPLGLKTSCAGAFNCLRAPPRK
jgi:hypothetical protein